MNKHTILFDLDGTLIEGTIPIVLGFQKSFEYFDANIPKEDEIKPLIGLPVEIMFERLGVPKHLLQNYRAQYKIEYYKRAFELTTLMPNAIASLELANKHATLGVVTTKTSAGSIKLLKHLKVDHFFEVFIGREDTTHPKPHPEPIFKALQGLKINPSQNCWMIGDTSMDTLSAKAANINSIGVLTGYEPKNKLKQHATHIKQDTLEAVEFILSPQLKTQH